MTRGGQQTTPKIASGGGIGQIRVARRLVVCGGWRGYHATVPAVAQPSSAKLAVNRD
jgi:hypothetical protein